MDLRYPRSWIQETTKQRIVCFDTWERERERVKLQGIKGRVVVGSWGGSDGVEGTGSRRGGTELGRYSISRDCKLCIDTCMPTCLLLLPLHGCSTPSLFSCLPFSSLLPFGSAISSSSSFLSLFGPSLSLGFAWLFKYRLMSSCFSHRNLIIILFRKEKKNISFKARLPFSIEPGYIIVAFGAAGLLRKVDFYLFLKISG